MTDDANNLLHRWSLTRRQRFLLAWFVFLGVTSYVSTYFLTAFRCSIGWMQDDGVVEYFDMYRIGPKAQFHKQDGYEWDQYCAKFFWPINQIDRRFIRPSYWAEPAPWDESNSQ